ncbi:MAG: fumarylacetoacetase [Betaproteobacteria bacterium]
MSRLDATHDPERKSFVASANDGVTGFSIQNLPFGIFSTDASPLPRAGVAIGNCIVDLAALTEAGLLRTVPIALWRQPTLNAFIALGRDVWHATRARLSEVLRAGPGPLGDDQTLRDWTLVPQVDATMHMPVLVPGYTDFYSSKEHATNVGSMFRDPQNALLPNWLEIPIGYNGRASSVVVSGTPVRRPLGQLKAPDAARPRLAPCRKLDIELETGFIVGQGNALGAPIAMADVDAHIFGMVLLNDWSARDIQQWEYVPLGPFNSKSFATSISPWLVTMEALEPFRVAGPEQDPEPLEYLQHDDQQAYDIHLEVTLQAQGARTATTICRTNFRGMYWSMAQQLVHHTIGGCNTRVGDLMGSGTISGTTEDSRGSLLEITWNGKSPLPVEGGTRTFLDDGDTVTMRGWCQGRGYRVGFGEVAGTILPAPR